MNQILNDFNQLEADQARTALLHCCAAKRWAHGLTSMRPFANEEELLLSSDKVCATMLEQDWMEAFRAHPRIGEQKVRHASAQSRAWSSEEQSSSSNAQITVLDKLAAGNHLYEQTFGFTYIVCATGKTADEMLTILEQRLSNDRDKELAEAAEQQRQITQLRLRKWLGL
jgi:OHCU decarboxylase